MIFEIAKLTEVIRQRGENNFVNLLNHVRTAELDDYDYFHIGVKICFTN